ncbi:ionic transporter y4hA [Ideonella sp. 4Y11]|uniref:Ionic transporter y4hA n=1 Tax=Ideonella aquatica TaxID=2824119 RepID=A0A941BHR0_9BURK|nr:ionic transporter y4hA [Ideonella aquatica]MBQ0957882.1 ionic transporter y4hA [Ideonella aquatica]
MNLWTHALPPLAVALLALPPAWQGGAMLLLPTAALMGAVLAAVHHAEVVAHRVGEPLGTLVLALAVTVIEAALIVTMMLAGGGAEAELPRDTIFSAVMIICNGVVGMCLLAGGWRHHEQQFRIEGANAGLAALIALCTLTLVLPTFTTSSAGPTYTASQLGFAAVASLVLWLVWVFVQTISHRDYFLPPGEVRDDPHVHAEPPSARAAWTSVALLLVALVGVVGLAKQLSPAIESAVRAAGAPRAVIGIVIAMLVLLPETVAALRAALANRLQTSMNLAFGSALASIGLTIPVVAVASLWLGLPLTLGLSPKDLALLVLTFLVSAVTLASGRSHLMLGAVHLVIFAAFLFLALVP